MKVICISGKARHGKDVTGSFIKEELVSRGYRVLVTHYSDLLKYICKTFFGWNGEKDDAGRKILQHVGTDVVRTLVPDFWVNFIIDILLMFSGEWDFVVIPDCRFPNEIERLRSFGIDSVLVRVIRSNFDNGLSEEAKNHISETALDNYNYDYVLMNTDLDELRRAVGVLVENIVGGEEVEEQEKGH